MARLCLLALALHLAQPGQLTLEIRVFQGAGEVTRQTRVTLHRAGRRDQPVARVEIGAPTPVMTVPPGIYDAQAVLERDGRVVHIRWAERLVVMPYPDEDGHHLEVINFASGYGALQVRAPAGRARDAYALFGSARDIQPAPAAAGQATYTLFVVPAGQYDLQVRRGKRTTWHNGIEVPLDRTRLWIPP